MHAENSLELRPLSRRLFQLWFVFCVISVLLWIACVVAHKLGWDPLSKHLLSEPLSDITVYITRFYLYRTPAFFTNFGDPTISSFAYPPAAALVYFLFYKVTPHPKYLYVAFSLLWGAFACVGSWLFCTRLLNSARRGSLLAASFLLFSFPFLFMVQRGNIEIVAWAVITMGLLAYLEGGLYAAAILLGVAASIKIYPVLLLGIFLSRRKDFGPAAAGLATFAGVTLFALWFTGPSIKYAAHGYLSGVAGFQDVYAEHIRAAEIGFDHSLFSVLKLIAIDHGIDPAVLTRPYYLVTGLVATVAFFLRANKLPFVNRLAFLVAGMILLPPVSYEYTLVHLFLLVPLLLAILLRFSGVEEAGQAKIAMGALACILCLLLPVDLYGTEHAFFAGQIQVLPLLLLMGLAVASPWGTLDLGIDAA